MKVYLLLRGYAYDGYSIEKVFSTQEKACAGCLKFIEDKRGSDNWEKADPIIDGEIVVYENEYGDYVFVKEWDVE
jgi:hypothetical protein